MRKLKASDWTFSFEDFDRFRDLVHLTHMVVAKVGELIPGCRVFFFIHNLSLREYREEDKEGVFSISEDNPLITYLALKNRIFDRKNLAEDPFFKDDEINAFLIIERLGISTLVPFVYRYRLLGFLGLRMPDDKPRLEKEEREFLHQLQKEVLHNLYAALLIDRRFSELVVLSELGKEISSIKDLPELYEVLFSKIAKVFSFNVGVLWIMDEEKSGKQALLGIKASKGLPDQYQGMTVKEGESISGFVYKAGKPLLIKELPKASFFFDRNQEPWLENSLISLPLKANNDVIGVLTLHNDQSGNEYTGENLHLVSIFSNFTAATISNIRLYRKLEKAYFDTITALVAALDAKDPYTAGHSERVMLYAVGVAEEMGLPPEKVRLIRFAAILHDIGKIGIKGEIIRKKEKLTDEEYKIIKQHPQIGEQIISAIDFLQEAREYIKYHHERMDGEGYYRMLLADIPREAMVLNIADSIDAMTTDRSYRKAVPFPVAIKKIKEEVGKQFHPDCYSALVRYLVKTGKLPKDFRGE